MIGKTSTSISKAELFSKVSEQQVLSAVFPQVREIPCLISSPLREDSHPSFSIYLDSGGHIRYKDYARPSVHGGLVDLLCAYWQCSFAQALDRVSQLMQASLPSVAIRPSTQAKPSPHRLSHSQSSLQVKVRPWRNYDFAYWASYGITEPWLRYAEVYPISHKIITKQDPTTGTSHVYTFPSDKYAYCYVERKEGKVQLKIYQPFNTRGYKWCSKMDASVIGLWTKIPQQGSRVVICSSLKDALVISCQLGIPTLCLQGEGYSMSSTAISELRRRYQKVFISFDTDEAGLQDGIKLAEHTGFINVVPNLGSQKDYSDYYKSLEDKQQFQQLKKLFI